MLLQTVEINGENRYLCKERGFLAVYAEGERLGRLPLDDLGLVLAAGHGLTYSNNLLLELSRRGVPLIVCDQGMRPAALFWPVEMHKQQGQRLMAQATASQPQRKRLWQELVQSKIAMQALAAKCRGENSGHLSELSRAVRSGDSGNAEATAARLYWKLLFGPHFLRDRKAGGVNALLNYGYTILRGLMARSVMLAGLHPSFSLHHSVERNALALVDDLMEPFRPMVDLVVLALLDAGEHEPTPAARTSLAALPILDMKSRKGTTLVAEAAKNLAASLADALLGKRKKLQLPSALPEISLPEELMDTTAC
ncbi:MAG: type II CRISPR-associated endonuclease Cas1 [Desulfovibrio sp.]